MERRGREEGREGEVEGVAAEGEGELSCEGIGVL